MPDITTCPNCGKLYEEPEEADNKAGWCRDCVSKRAVAIWNERRAAGIPIGGKDERKRKAG